MTAIRCIESEQIAQPMSRSLAVSLEFTKNATCQIQRRNDQFLVKEVCVDFEDVCSSHVRGEIQAKREHVKNDRCPQRHVLACCSWGTYEC